MNDALSVTGMVGPFWVVEHQGKAALLALVVPLAEADPYGDMLGVDTGHDQYWSGLARRGARALHEAGIPTAPVWSEYDEWPRGRVLYDRVEGKFVVRTDLQLHHPAFLQLVIERFGLDLATTSVLSDDHYRSVRRVPLPGVE